MGKALRMMFDRQNKSLPGDRSISFSIYPPLNPDYLMSFFTFRQIPLRLLS